MSTTCRDCGAWTPGTERCILHDPESFQAAAPAEFAHYSNTWTTGCELEFIRRMAKNEPESTYLRQRGGYRPGAFADYARIVLDDMRAYGPGVDVAKVKAEVRRLIGG
jgi:hypothetical protein